MYLNIVYVMMNVIEILARAPVCCASS